MFLLQEVSSSFPPTGAMVAAAPPEVSQVAGNTPHRGCHMRQMYFDPFRVFWFCQTPYIASCFQKGGRIGRLICRCSGGGDRVNDSSFDIAGVVIREADTFSGTEGVTVKTAGPSTAGGSIGLGWVASSTSTPGNPCIRPSKHHGH